jgi:hypothetical protein
MEGKVLLLVLSTLYLGDPPSFLCNAFPYTLCVDTVLDPKWRGEGKEKDIKEKY